jgi:hypothetical protein
MRRIVLASAAALFMAGLAPPDPAPPPALPSLGARFLVPSSFQVEPARPFTVSLASARAQAEPWNNDEVAWMFARVAATQRNMDRPPLDAAGQPSLTLDTPGVGVIGVDLKPRDITVALKDLEKFISEHATARDKAAPPPGAKDARIRRVESLKAILRSGPPGAEAGRSEATGKTGQAAEIRPLMDPSALLLPSDLAVRAYAGSAAAAGARLFATHLSSGRTQEFRCDSTGYGHFNLDAPGQWRVELHLLAVDIAQQGEDPGPPLTLYSATLTFEAPRPPAAGGAP